MQLDSLHVHAGVGRFPLQRPNMDQSCSLFDDRAHYISLLSAIMKTFLQIASVYIPRHEPLTAHARLQSLPRRLQARKVYTLNVTRPRSSATNNAIEPSTLFSERKKRNPTSNPTSRKNQTNLATREENPIVLRNRRSDFPGR